jgi:uncharacterized LabA/DUF88 family protein
VILIDGGFVRHKLGTQQQAAKSSDIRELVRKIRAHESLSAHDLHRIYYYDAAPLDSTHVKPLEGGIVEFGKEPLFARSQQLFLELSREPHFALRMGELSFNGWAVRPGVYRRAGAEARINAGSLKPLIAQKGVDMRIGMDIAALTLKHLADIIVMITGDSDFVPAMKFARREGAQLFLVPLGHGIKEAMREHSDVLIDLDPPTQFGFVS